MTTHTENYQVDSALTLRDLTNTHFNPVDINGHAVFSDDFARLVVAIIPAFVDIFRLPYVDNITISIKNFINTTGLGKGFEFANGYYSYNSSI